MDAQLDNRLSRHGIGKPVPPGPRSAATNRADYLDIDTDAVNVRRQIVLVSGLEQVDLDRELASVLGDADSLNSGIAVEQPRRLGFCVPRVP